MASPHRKNSPWFKHPAGIGWKCTACGCANAATIKHCSRCVLPKYHTMEDRLKMMEKQK